MPYEEAVEMLKKSIKKMYGKKAWWCLTVAFTAACLLVKLRASMRSPGRQGGEDEHRRCGCIH